MTQFSLTGVGNRDLQTSFRYQLILPAHPEIGMFTPISYFCTSAEIPGASNEAIPTHWAMGRQGHQGGKSKTKPVSYEFMVPTEGNDSIINLVEKWNDATFNIDTGTNKGKKNYTFSNITLRLMGQNNLITKSYVLTRAQITDIDRGTLSAESNEIAKVKMTLVYDDYKVFDGNGNQIVGVR